ncbi:MAG: SufBD protein [Candidatus Limiplasma sp.]|nr:SufBD protein [Candidatus Limiplasma sp.]
MVEIKKMTPAQKQALEQRSKELLPGQIRELVAELTASENERALEALLLLYFRSNLSPDVYPYMDAFAQLMDSKQSFHRTRGIFLLSINAKWDGEGKLDAAFDQFLDHAQDEKAITARQCIQSLANVIPHKPGLGGRIKEKLEHLDLSGYTQNMKPLVMKDALEILSML